MEKLFEDIPSCGGYREAELSLQAHT